MTDLNRGLTSEADNAANRRDYAARTYIEQFLVLSDLADRTGLERDSLICLLQTGSFEHGPQGSPLNGIGDIADAAGFNYEEGVGKFKGLLEKGYVEPVPPTDTTDLKPETDIKLSPSGQKLYITLADDLRDHQDWR